MKKIYISPVAREISIESQNILIGSGDNGSIEGNINNEMTTEPDLAPVRMDIFNYGGLQ